MNQDPVLIREIRLRCLELACAQAPSNPDVDRIRARAEAFVRFVLGETGDAAPAKTGSADTSSEFRIRIPPGTAEAPGKSGRKKQAA